MYRVNEAESHELTGYTRCPDWVDYPAVNLLHNFGFKFYLKADGARAEIWSNPSVPDDPSIVEDYRLLDAFNATY